MRAIEDLLTDLFAGVVLPEEERMYLKTWMQEPQHNRELERLEWLRKNTYVVFAGKETDYARLLETIEKKSRNRRMVKIIRYAACFLLPLTLGILIFLNWPGEELKITGHSLADSCILPRKSNLPALILSSGEEVVLDTLNHDLTQLLAYNGVVTGNQTLKYEGLQAGKHVLKVPKGSEYRLVLSDHTLVWINAESELEYPVTFNGAERRVKLRGEAYFEVTKDKLHPFVVETNRAVATVLGTSFNVCDYAGESADITLAEGSLQVVSRADETDQCLLAPRENVRIDHKLTLQKKIDMDNYIGWRKGIFSFHKMRLEEVFIKLSRWYDFEYVFTDPGLKNFLFTAWFDRNDPFDVIVRRLEQTGRIRTVIKDRRVTVYNVKR